MRLEAAKGSSAVKKGRALGVILVVAVLHCLPTCCHLGVSAGALHWSAGEDSRQAKASSGSGGAS